MYKVLIADDEKKVCQLIKILVEWDSLDMEVVGMVHNGYEALEMVREKKPQIIITDIRMPGLNGLEMIQEVRKEDQKIKFIIISGHREFKYAQAAVKYGVNEYLLKPIRQEELVNTLLAIKEKFRQQDAIISSEEQLKKQIEDNRLKLRKRLFLDVLFKGTSKKSELQIDFINEEYNYSFQKGCFQVICIKLDHAKKIYHSNTQILEDKSVHLLMQELSPYCFDLGVIYENGVISCILNFLNENELIIKNKIKTLLKNSMLQDAIYQPLEVTVGMGTVSEHIEEMIDSYRHAESAYQQRILNGTGKVLECITEYNSGLADSIIFQEFNKSFPFSINNLNLNQIQDDIDSLKKNLLERTETTGHEILQMTKEVCNLYLLYMRSNNLYIEDSENFIQEFNEYADDCNSTQELFRHLSQTISKSIVGIIEDKRQETTKPIRLAKQYVEQKYMNSLTIEDVSLQVGFSSSHFSTIFKKETGVTFLEFLSSVRMKHAKDLLKEGNKNIAVICEEVGYSDVKYFTKSFRKHTGLKPNEYRKLYS
ncbi:MAG: response regulator [Velocimicrobium sp.]